MPKEADKREPFERLYARLEEHVQKLEQGGLVVIRKEFNGKHPITYIMLTPEGRQGLSEHWARLDAIRRSGGVIEPLKAL